MKWLLYLSEYNVRYGGRPTNDISIAIEIQWKFLMLLFITYSADHNEIVHKSQQRNCPNVCKISLWLVGHVLNQSTPNYSIEIPLVGRTPGYISYSFLVWYIGAWTKWTPWCKRHFQIYLFKRQLVNFADVCSLGYQALAQGMDRWRRDAKQLFEPMVNQFTYAHICHYVSSS